MQIHTLQLKNPRKKKKDVGRGGRKGSYSGRGMKGQKARSGASVDPLFEGGKSTLIDHMKKKKGFISQKTKAITVSLAVLEKKFDNDTVVNKEALVEKGIISRKDSSYRIKILGSGGIKKKLTIEEGILVSGSSRSAIENAGGKFLAREKKK